MILSQKWFDLTGYVYIMVKEINQAHTFEYQ